MVRPATAICCYDRLAAITCATTYTVDSAENIVVACGDAALASDGAVGVLNYVLISTYGGCARTKLFFEQSLPATGAHAKPM